MQRYGAEIWCYNKPYSALFSGLLKVFERLALWKPKVTQSLSFTALTKIALLYRKIQLIATNLTLFELLAKLGFIKRDPLPSLAATERVNLELFSVRFLALGQFGKPLSSRELRIFVTQIDRLLQFLHFCLWAGNFNCSMLMLICQLPLWPLEYKYQPGSCICQYRFGQSFTYRHVLGKFPRSQHRPLLITPPWFTRPVPSKPAKRWNFCKAKWSHYITLTNKLARNLPPLIHLIWIRHTSVSVKPSAPRRKSISTVADEITVYHVGMPIVKTSTRHSCNTLKGMNLA